MRAIPAIDILDGQCVRLTKGDYDSKTVYDSNPSRVALKWQAQGAALIHVVDLDGARAGRPVNTGVISQILKAVSVPIEVGGGIRSFDSASLLLGSGVHRVVLGTGAVTAPDLVQRLVERFGPERVVVGIDAKAGKVATSGWTEVQPVDAIDLALSLKTVGIEEIIYTDIDRDGTMVGPSMESTRTLAVRTGLSIIASGGVSQLADLVSLKQLETDGVTGVILGKALYENAFSLSEAVDVLR